VLRILLVTAIVLGASSASALADKKCDTKIHAKIRLRASFAHDRGCIFQALVVNGKRYEDVTDATPRAMAVLGWRRAKEAKRGELAMMWIADVLARVGEYRVVYTALDDSTDDFKARFYEPKTVIDDGAVTIRYWRDETRIGMRRPTTRELVETEVTIDRDGTLSVTDLSTAAEPF
jgi:hypothetical protein